MFSKETVQFLRQRMPSRNLTGIKDVVLAEHWYGNTGYRMTALRAEKIIWRKRIPFIFSALEKGKELIRCPATDIPAEGNQIGEFDDRYHKSDNQQQQQKKMHDHIPYECEWII